MLRWEGQDFDSTGWMLTMGVCRPSAGSVNVVEKSQAGNGVTAVFVLEPEDTDVEGITPGFYLVDVVAELAGDVRTVAFGEVTLLPKNSDAGSGVPEGALTLGGEVLTLGDEILTFDPL